MHTFLQKGWDGIARCPLDQWNRWGVRLSLGAVVLVTGALSVSDWQSRQPQTLPVTQTLMVNGQSFALEVAVTEAEKQKGLQSRPSLPPSQGMLFPFTPSQSVAFWLWRTQPLDLLWLRQNQVVGRSPQLPTCTLSPKACPLYQSPGPVTAVVELPAGATRGIRIGDRVTRWPRPPTRPPVSAQEVMP